MDNRGQAFSAFQLLISAVVAVAILAIIMSILGLIPRPSQDPTQAVGSVLQNVVNSPGTLLETTSVIFSKNTTIASETLATGVGLDPSQICLDRGEYENEASFKLLGGDSGNQVLQWAGTNERQAKIAVLCALTGPNLEEYINTYEETLKPADTGSCGCLGEEGRCCLVMLKKA